jgi:hypothetical protein
MRALAAAVLVGAALMGAALMGAALMGATIVGAASAATVTDNPVELANPDIDELSGLALSRADPAVLWGHNDTGAGPVLYRFGPRGEDFGAVHVPGAKARDWEDLAAFEQDGAPALLIADTGDNFSLRTQLTLYAVSDPGRAGEPRLLWALAFRFPDGAHDCEAVAVDPVAREILLVTKRDQPARLYRLPLPARALAGVAQAEFLAELPDLRGDPLPARLLGRFANSATALTLSRDGATAVLVTPRHAYVYRRPAGASWAQVLARPGIALDLPPLKQIEAAALSVNGRELIVGSEGRPARLARIALPQ